MAYVDSSAFSYGAGAFGSYAFGVDAIPAITAASAAVSAAGNVIKVAVGSVSASASTSSTAGITANSSAIVSGSAGVTAVNVRVKEGASAVSSTTAIAVNATAILSSGAAVSSTASITSVAEEFVLKESDKFSYGTGTYGSYVYDNADLQTISSATLSATQADYIRIRTVSGSGSASASNSSDSIRVREGAAIVSSSATIAADGAFTVNGNPETIDVTSGVSISYIRKRNAEAIKAAQSVVVAIGREKWETIAVGSNTWTKIPEASDIWTKLAA